MVCDELQGVKLEKWGSILGVRGFGRSGPENSASTSRGPWGGIDRAFLLGQGCKHPLRVRGSEPVSKL